MLKRPSATRPVRRALLLAWALCCALSATGCMTQPTNFSQPGPIDVQQRRAIRLDPYPNQRIAPEIVGGRPREYQADRSEVDRARLLREAWWGFPL